MNVIIIETLRRRCNVTGNVIKETDVILNTSNSFKMAAQSDRIEIICGRHKRNHFGKIEVKSPTGEILMQETTKYADQIAKSVIDVGANDVVTFSKRAGLLIMTIKKPIGQVIEYLVVNDFIGIKVAGRREITTENSIELSPEVTTVQWQLPEPQLTLTPSAPYPHAVSLIEVDENGTPFKEIRFDEFFNMDKLNDKYTYRMGRMQVQQIWNTQAPVANYELHELRGIFYPLL